jgi:SAM-dependent methyltransferase
MEAIRRAIANLPVLGPLARRAYAALRPERRFTDSNSYWESRYASGRDSGAGSYNRLAQFKASVINSFVEENQVADVIEFGCGDGAQLRLANYQRYIGVDVSSQAIALCRKRFSGDATKTFYSTSDLPVDAAADLALSLDVVYHLVEDEVFERYMRQLFECARQFVIIYSSNEDRDGQAPHVRHREFTRWVSENAPQSRLMGVVKNKFPYDPEYPHKTSFADFYIFQKES